MILGGLQQTIFQAILMEIIVNDRSTEQALFIWQFMIRGELARSSCPSYQSMDVSGQLWPRFFWLDHR